MAYISVFKVNQEGSALDLVVSADEGETIDSIMLWTQNTFKDYTQALDFSSKLSGLTNNESITILASEIGETQLNGIYFVEAIDSSTPEPGCNECSNTVLGVATDFSRFAYCIIEFLCKMEECCGDCNHELNKALTMKLYMDGLRNTLQLGNFTTAIKFWENLNRACDPVCKECGALDNVAKKGLGFQTLGNQILLY
jgi:hypothetical protein